MIFNSNNEYGKLRSVVIGRAANANWPTDDPNFTRYWKYACYTKDVKFPYKFDNEIIEHVDEMICDIIDTLNELDIEVVRPRIENWTNGVATHQYVTTGMNTLAMRENLISIGNKVIECPHIFRAKHWEGSIAYQPIKKYVQANGGVYITAPRIDLVHGTMTHDTKKNELVCRNEDPIFSGCDILKFGKTILYFTSCKSNMLGAEWLQGVLGDEFKVVPTNRFYFYEGLNNNILPLDDSTLLVNADRIGAEAIPKELKDYRKIMVSDIKDTKCFKHAYGSKYQNFQILSLDPVTKIVDTGQPQLSKLLTAYGFKVIEKNLPHTQTFGFGYHSLVTDLVRD